jgi:RimJ/RimL family protein N-acetyltransferase
MDVQLRRLRADDFDALWAARTADRAGHERPGAHDRLRTQIERSGRLVEGRLDLGIESDGRLLGTIEARQPSGALPRGCYEIGILLFEQDRGRGAGTQAVELITELLFAEHEGERIQASTWVENQPMRSVLVKLGFVFEGVMRGFWPLDDGTRQDFALYAVTKGEWAALHPPVPGLDEAVEGVREQPDRDRPE